MMLLATQRGDVERNYTCPRCGAKGAVTFHAIGHGNSVSLMPIYLRGVFRLRRLNDFGEMGNPQDEAEVQQRRDADRIMGLIRCPSCHKRPLGAFVWPTIRLAAYAVLGLLVVLAQPRGLGLPLWSGAAALGAFSAVVELRRFGRARRVATLELVPGPSTATLPAARVVKHVPDVPPPPVQRAIAPPPQLPPVAPGAEPSILVGNARDPAADP